MLRPISITTTALTADCHWLHNITSSGVYSQVRIAAAHTGAPTLRGDGSLFWLTVEVVGTDGMTTPLDLREYVSGGGTMIYNPGGEVPLTLSDGAFTVGCAYRKGDVSGDCEVNSYDVYLLLQLITHPDDPPTAQELVAGDVNGNGRLDGGDSAMILYYIVHGEWPRPGGSEAGRTAGAPVTLRLDSIAGPPGSTVRATLSAEGLTDWAGGEFAIAYDPALVAEIDAVDTASLSQGFDIAYTAQDGLRIALADGAQHAGGDGVLLAFDVHIAPDAPIGAVTELALTEARLYDVYGRDLEISALQRDVARQSGTLQITDTYYIHLPLVIR